MKSRMRQFFGPVDETIFGATREPSFSAMFRERMKTMPEEQRQTRFANGRSEQARAADIDLRAGKPALRSDRQLGKAFKRKGCGAGGVRGRLRQQSPSRHRHDPIQADETNLIDIWLDDHPATADWWALQDPAQRRRLYPRPASSDDIAAMQEHGGSCATGRAPAGRLFRNQPYQPSGNSSAGGTPPVAGADPASRG